MKLRFQPAVLASAACVALILTPHVARAQQAEQIEVGWQTSAVDYRGMFSKAFSVYCPPAGARGATVWGSGIYTDDSAICIAAVHSLATFDFARGGTVLFAMEPGQEAYDAERRRGITTQSYNAWDGSYRIIAGIPGKRGADITASTPVEVTWFTTAKHLRGNVEGGHPVMCPRNGELRRVWGSDVYNDDSSICSAAVHAGLITRVSGGGVMLRVEPGREGYVGSRRNSVTSLPWEKGEGSFAFPKGQVVAALPPVTDVEVSEPRRAEPQVAAAAAPRPPAVRNASGDLTVDWQRTAAAWRGLSGTVHNVYCPPGGTLLPVWGTDVYTDDSSVCNSAVHALSTFSFAAGGTVYFEMLPGMDAYTSTNRRGVGTNEWGSWESSFRIVSGAPGKRIMEITDSTQTEISWSTTAEHLRGKLGVRRLVCPREGVLRPVWGADSYSDNSSVCSAAVHAGVITRADGGSVQVRVAAGRNAYASATRAGITSKALGAWQGSFSFVKQD